jgi:hypothetical protein
MPGAAPTLQICRGVRDIVATEVARQITWQENAPRQYHYRDRDGREVDIVLERRDGEKSLRQGLTLPSAGLITTPERLTTYK